MNNGTTRTKSLNFAIKFEIVFKILKMSFMSQTMTVEEIEYRFFFMQTIEF